MLPGEVRSHLASALALALLSLATAACNDPAPPPTLTPTAMLIPSPTIAPTLAPPARPTPSSAPTPTVKSSPVPTPTATLAPSPTPVATAPASTSAPPLTPTPAPEWEFHSVTADGSTVVVELRVSAWGDVSVKLNGREPHEVSFSEGILRQVFRDVEPGRRSVLVYDATGLSASRKIDVAASSPTLMANTEPLPTITPTPTPTATPVASPKATPTPTRQELMEKALSEFIPWYDDPPYPLALTPIREIWQRDSDLGRELAQARWLADGLAHWEDDAVYGLGHLIDYDPALAIRMLAHTVEEPVRSRNTMLLSTLGRMLSQHRETFELLIARPWFADGLDAEERALITAMSHTTGIGEIYRGLLAERHSRSATISLPLAGEVDLWVFSNDAPPNEAVMAVAERGARDAERIMAAPFPLTDLIVLSIEVDEYDVGYGGVNWGDSLVLLRGEKMGPSDYDEILYHEIAHFWLGADIGPFWLYEGGANMVAEYVGGDGQPLEGNEGVLSYCGDNGVPNIHALSDPDHPNPVAQSTCSYGLGHNFLATLFNTIGEAAFSSAMRELYESYLDYRPPATEEQVYRIFLKHAPPDREAAFLDAYRRLHGGPFLDGN